MSSNPRARTYTCEVCHKPTTRMFGFAGTVLPDNGPGGTSMRAAIHGYCREHRDLVEDGFPASLRAEGTARMFLEHPAELRPDTVAAFQAGIDELRIAFAEQAGMPAKDLRAGQDPIPDGCPHCSAELAWGTGPHQFEAASRGNARAWECPNCGAAGMLMFIPDAT